MEIIMTIVAWAYFLSMVIAIFGFMGIGEFLLIGAPIRGYEKTTYEGQKQLLAKNS